MYDKAVHNYIPLEFVPHYYKTQKMCYNAVSIYPSAIRFVPEYYKTQEMCDKAVNTCFLYFILFLINISLKKHITKLFPSDMSVHRSKKCGNVCKGNTVGDALEEMFCI